MPRLKAEQFSFDEDELEGAEWSDEEFSSYDGPEPPVGTVLRGFVKKMWISESQNGTDMLVVLFEATDNIGKEKQYNGWASWDYLVLQANAKFRWQPFLNATGLSLRDIRTKMYVEEDEERNGLPIEKIGTWEPGEDNDAAWVCVITKRESYLGEWTAKIAKYLPFTEPEEEEPEPAPTRRSRKSSGTQAPKRSSRAAAPEEDTEPEADDEEDEDEVDEEEATPPARGRGATAKAPARSRAAAAPARTSRRSAAAPARGRGRGRAAGSTEEPPFEEPPF